jgi:type II secretion system protein N
MLLRLGLFLVAFVVGIVLLAPLDKWLLPRIKGPLADAGADLRLDGLHFALPAGIRATGVGIDAGDTGIDIDSLYVGIWRDFDAKACGGQISGNVGSERLVFNLSKVDLSRCLRFGKLALESTLDGSFSLSGIDLRHPVFGRDASAHIDIASDGGVFRGTLPHGGADGAELPLGEWEFSALVLRATLTGGNLAVEEGHAETSGVRWELLGASLPSSDSRGGLKLDFRARQVEDNPRSRALIGLMPKTTVDAGGWHNWRVVGSIDSPRVVGVN